MKRTFIFYHLFMPVDSNWKPIFKFHLDKIIDSGLYDKINQMNVGIIFTEEKSLDEFKIEFIEKFEKLNLLYSRNLNSLPIKIWDDPDKEISTQLGEGETILKMTKFAQSRTDKDIYLFIHSKGVTSPPNRKRSQIRHFYKKGLNENSSDAQIQNFIQSDMTKETITKWEEIIETLKNNEFYYYIWNFFWVRGSLLKKFNFKKFDKNGCFPKGHRLDDPIKWKPRHWSAIFPINLYGVVNNISFKSPNILQNNLIGSTSNDIEKSD